MERGYTASRIKNPSTEHILKKLVHSVRPKLYYATNHSSQLQGPDQASTSSSRAVDSTSVADLAHEPSDVPVSSPTATDSAQSLLSEAVVPHYTNPSPAPSSDLPVSPGSSPPPSLTSSPHTLAEQNSNSQSTYLSCVQGMYKYTGNIETDIYY